MAQAASATASTPAPATTTAPTTQTTSATLTTTTPTATVLGWFTGVGGILSLVFLLVFHFGAAKLSYDVNQSAGWAFLSFLFASVYYPYYAFAHSSRREASILSSIVGGRRRKH